MLLHAGSNASNGNVAIASPTITQRLRACNLSILGIEAFAVDERGSACTNLCPSNFTVLVPVLLVLDSQLARANFLSEVSNQYRTNRVDHYLDNFLVILVLNRQCVVSFL